MQPGWLRITRRRALTALLFLLLIAPIPLFDVADANDPHAPLTTGPKWGWLIMVFVLMGSAVRGDRSALGLWATLSGVIGAAMILWGLSAQNGGVRLLGGLVGLAAAIVFALLRDELGRSKQRDPVTQTRRPPVH